MTDDWWIEEGLRQLGHWLKWRRRIDQFRRKNPAPGGPGALERVEKDVLAPLNGLMWAGRNGEVVPAGYLSEFVRERWGESDEGVDGLVADFRKRLEHAQANGRDPVAVRLALRSEASTEPPPAAVPAGELALGDVVRSDWLIARALTRWRAHFAECLAPEHTPYSHLENRAGDFRKRAQRLRREMAETRVPVLPSGGPACDGLEEAANLLQQVHDSAKTRWFPENAIREPEPKDGRRWLPYELADHWRTIQAALGGWEPCESARAVRPPANAVKLAATDPDLAVRLAVVQGLVDRIFEGGGDLERGFRLLQPVVQTLLDAELERIEVHSKSHSSKLWLKQEADSPLLEDLVREPAIVLRAGNRNPDDGSPRAESSMKPLLIRPGRVVTAKPNGRALAAIERFRRLTTGPAAEAAERCAKHLAARDSTVEAWWASFADGREDAPTVDLCRLLLEARWALDSAAVDLRVAAEHLLAELQARVERADAIGSARRPTLWLVWAEGGLRLHDGPPERGGPPAWIVHGPGRESTWECGTVVRVPVAWKAEAPLKALIDHEPRLLLLRRRLPDRPEWDEFDDRKAAWLEALHHDAAARSTAAAAACGHLIDWCGRLRHDEPDAARTIGDAAAAVHRRLEPEAIARLRFPWNPETRSLDVRALLVAADRGRTQIRWRVPAESVGMSPAPCGTILSERVAADGSLELDVSLGRRLSARDAAWFDLPCPAELAEAVAFLPEFARNLDAAATDALRAGAEVSAEAVADEVRKLIRAIAEHGDEALGSLIRLTWNADAVPTTRSAADAWLRRLSEEKAFRVWPRLDPATGRLAAVERDDPWKMQWAFDDVPVKSILYPEKTRFSLNPARASAVVGRGPRTPGRLDTSAEGVVAALATAPPDLRDAAEPLALELVAASDAAVQFGEPIDAERRLREWLAVVQPFAGRPDAAPLVEAWAAWGEAAGFRIEPRDPARPGKAAYPSAFHPTVPAGGLVIERWGVGRTPEEALLDAKATASAGPAPEGEAEFRRLAESLRTAGEAGLTESADVLLETLNLWPQAALREGDVERIGVQLFLQFWEHCAEPLRRADAKKFESLESTLAQLLDSGFRLTTFTPRRYGELPDDALENVSSQLPVRWQIKAVVRPGLRGARKEILVPARVELS